MFNKLVVCEKKKGPGHLARLSLEVERAAIAQYSFGCGSKIGTQNGTLVSGNMDQNLWSPGGLILTHTHLETQQGEPRESSDPEGSLMRPRIVTHSQL